MHRLRVNGWNCSWSSYAFKCQATWRVDGADSDNMSILRLVLTWQVRQGAPQVLLEFHCLDTVTDDITEDKGVQTGGMRLHGRVGDLYAQVLVVGVEGGALRVPPPVR